MFGSRTRAVALVLAAAALSALALASGALRRRRGRRRRAKAVYVLTNDPDGNAVVVHSRSGDGSLAPAGSYPTGGNCGGAGLGSQDAVIVSDEGRFLFALDGQEDRVQMAIGELERDEQIQLWVACVDLLLGRRCAGVGRRGYRPARSAPRRSSKRSSSGTRARMRSKS
jgi:hypothetical protein